MRLRGLKLRVGIATQIAIVPIYLNYWDVKTYGLWLAIQAIVAFLSMLDFGHQQYLGYEFLKIGTENRRLLSKYLWSGISVGFCISLFQIALIVILLFSGALPYLLGEAGTTDTEMLDDAGIVLLFQIIMYLIVISISGLMTRVLNPFGHFPRMAWWAVVGGIITAVIPLSAVVSGAGLLITGIVTSLSLIVVYGIPLYIDLFRLLSKENIRFSRPSLKVGYKNFLQSLALSGKSLLDNFRQQGTRLVLAPLSGAVGLAAFSTMRTGANVALQGLNTITNPLMPDLIRFLHHKDQGRTEAAFGAVWIVVIALMAPGVVILQVIVEPLYTWWTDGKITFDPLLFAVLSMGVLVYAVIQPAMAVVTGNNILKPQVWLSFFAAVIVIGGTFLLVPVVGILGAGLALLASELAISFGYLFFAKQWLGRNELLWPGKAFYTAVGSVCVAGLSMGAMIALPQMKWLILSLALVLFAVNLKIYWDRLPPVALERARQLAVKIPGIKTIVKIPGIKMLFGQNFRI